MNLIAWMNEVGIIDGQECDSEQDELFFAKQVFRSFLVADYSLRPQSVPRPLGQSRF